MQKGVKFRIYPNKEQKTILNQTLGCCRLIYNKGLAMRNEAYQNGNKIGYSQKVSVNETAYGDLSYDRGRGHDRGVF